MCVLCIRYHYGWFSILEEKQLAFIPSGFWSGLKMVHKKNVCICPCEVMRAYMEMYICIFVSLQVGVRMWAELQLLNTSIW